MHSDLRGGNGENQARHRAFDLTNHQLPITNQYSQMVKFFTSTTALALLALACVSHLDAETPGPDTPNTSGIQHVIWIWFENKEISDLMGSSAPTFSSFANNNVNFANFYAVTHPSQPNYLRAFSGSTQGVSTNDHFSFPASADNLAKQLATAGKSWRVYVQDYPGNCFDGDSFFGGIDGPGVSGQYVRKHNPVISFESVRLNPAECANVQPLANFDPTVNFSFVTPNMTNDMHDGTIEQGDAFLQAFLPLVTSSPDWAHTLLIVSFDEGTTTVNGGGHIYTAAAAPWLSHATVATTYNHYSVLRTIEEIFGLPYLVAPQQRQRLLNSSRQHRLRHLPQLRLQLHTSHSDSRRHLPATDAHPTADAHTAADGQHLPERSSIVRALVSIQSRV